MPGARWLLLGAALALSGTVLAEDQGPGPTAASDLVAQGLAYEHGEGMPKDQRLAAALYCQGALAGDPEAMFSLGWMYANGRGVNHDDAIAATLFARAAAAGHAEARKMLHYVSEQGEDIPDCMQPVDSEPALASPTEAVDPFANLPPDKRKIAQQVIKLAGQYGVDARLALAVAATESDFKPAARSHKDARGVMQLIADTAERFNVRNRFDVEASVRGGLAYLRWLLAYYQGRVALAVAAYNAGEAAVDRYKGIPPYPETRDYVQRVLRLYPSERHAYDARIVKPSPALIPSDDGSK